MKKYRLFVYGILLFLVALSGWFAFVQKAVFPLEAESKLALREVGHKLLLANKDSHSLVQPVQQVAPTTYLLQFEKSLAISPDSLVHFIKASVAKTQLQDFYLVEVLRCADQEVAYSFRMQKEENKNIIPCATRTLPVDCYQIRALWKHTSVKSSFPYTFYTLLILLIGYSIWDQLGNTAKTTTQKTVTSPPKEQAIALGSICFYPEQHKLLIAETDIALSAKENQLLLLLASRSNAVIKREELSKRIWEDKGVIVGRSLDTYISKLRKKLSKDPSLQIVNVHGVGYKLVVGG
ncbi:MAG: winged helix-turn-helix domain-containing protein [Flavobacteriaceae bacterium]|nr:winged helix-turn-helix domain-containing protein [Flavobacteriaceae bacterium]